MSTMQLGVWLLPPMPVRAQLEENVAAFAQRRGLPAFDPHVTLLTGPSLRTADVDTAVVRLQRVAGAGGVPCRFVAIGQGKGSDGAVPWYQSAVAIAEESPQLTRVAQLVRDIFAGVESNGGVEWAPPLGRPHMSLAYGSGPDALGELTLPAPFHATEVSLVCLEPGCLDGVPQWHELARVPLAHPHAVT
jgi:hypothetical protein